MRLLTVAGSGPGADFPAPRVCVVDIDVVSSCGRISQGSKHLRETDTHAFRINMLPVTPSTLTAIALLEVAANLYILL